MFIYFILSHLEKGKAYISDYLLPKLAHFVKNKKKHKPSIVQSRVSAQSGDLTQNAVTASLQPLLCFLSLSFG